MKDMNNITVSGTVSKVYKSGFGLDIAREYQGKEGMATSTTRVFVKGNEDLLSTVKEGAKVVVTGSLSSQQKQDKSISLCIYAFWLGSLQVSAPAKTPDIPQHEDDEIPF
jgi:hypothetical protein